MRLRLALLSAFLVVSLCLPFGCGTSPKEACEEAIKLTCEKWIKCLPQKALDMIGYTDQAACESKLKANMKCEESDPCAKQDPPKTWNATTATKCIDELKALECSSKMGGAQEIQDKTPSCQKVCE